MTDKGPFRQADLPLTDGRVYHLDLAPGELAGDVIIVGDPERVPLIAGEFFAVTEVDRSHRGFRTVTGRVRESGQRISLVTSGIGAPSLEIVLNELVALNEIDLATRTRKEAFEPLTVVRLGTSGGLQPDAWIGSLVVTECVVGLDNTALFYDIPAPDSVCAALEERVRKTLEAASVREARFRGRIFPYTARAHREVSAALEKAAAECGVPCRRGVTVSSPSFFAGEGRMVARVPATVSGLDDLLAPLDTGIAGVRFENVEMEAGFLLHFLGGIGYRAGVVCAVIDNRQAGTFVTRYRDTMLDAARVALRALGALRGG